MGYARFDKEGGEELSLLTKKEGLRGAVAIVVEQRDGECCCCYRYGGYERGEEEAHFSLLFFSLSLSPSFLVFFAFARVVGVVEREEREFVCVMRRVGEIGKFFCGFLVLLRRMKTKASQTLYSTEKTI